MGLTAIQGSDQALAFEQVHKAHRAMLARFPSYKEVLASDDPQGYFEIHFSGAIPAPPSAEAIELQHLSIAGYVGKQWKQGAALYEQLLDFQNEPARYGADCTMGLRLEMRDPGTSLKDHVTIDLPKSASAISNLQITFYDSPGTPGWDKAVRARCVDAILRPTFPNLSVENLADGFEIVAGERRFVFGQRYQTFTGTVTVPWSTSEVVEQFPKLVPREWKPKPQLDWLINYGFSKHRLESANYFAAWKAISERIGPTPEGMITLDFVLRSIEGLETIRSGPKRKRGVPVTLGEFCNDGFRGELVARVFDHGYRLEIHTKTPNDELATQIGQVAGVKFQNASGAQVV